MNPRGPRRPRPSSRPAPSTWRTTTWTRRYREALFDPADPGEYVLVKDFNAAAKRADINMNSESLNEKLGDWGYRKQQKKISGRNQYVIHGMRLVVERPEY
jgi:hypothetical protein